jgi:acetyl-CoA/propionyl-CoA carboxylase biotin carboxyl carrier protein
VTTFDTVLVANRGEIAVRVIRTLRRMGIRGVAVYSDADAGARHVVEADTAVLLGPAPARHSYLNIAAVVGAAVRSGAQAVHPGYGFLSENADFAAALMRAGIVFIGPPAKAIATMGDKITAKDTVARFGVPVVPGIARPGLTDAELIAAADDIGYPVLVKPSAGGGGKGMRLVDVAADLPGALVSARRESAAAFGDDTLFLERFVLHPDTSRCRSSPTPTVMSCTSVSASAACSAGTRKSSRRHRRRCSTRRPGHASGLPPATLRAASITSARAPSSSSCRRTTQTSSSSWR